MMKGSVLIGGEESGGISIQGYIPEAVKVLSAAGVRMREALI